jgi:hypothetical protein
MELIKSGKFQLRSFLTTFEALAPHGTRVEMKFLCIYIHLHVNVLNLRQGVVPVFVFIAFGPKVPRFNDHHGEPATE